MASQAIKNLQNLLVDKVLVEAKFRVKEEAYKQILKLREMIPTKDEIKKMILDAILEAACSIPAQKKLTTLYNSMHGLMEKIEGLIGKGVGTLQKISDKVKAIETKVLAKIESILEKLKPFIIAMRIVIEIAPTSLAASTGPVNNGLVEDQLGRKIDLAMMYIALYAEIIMSYIDMIPLYINKIKKIVIIVDKALYTLKGLLAKVSALKAYLEFLFLNFIGSCNTPNFGEATDNEGNVNIENSIDNILDNNSLGNIDGNFDNVANMMNMLYNDLLEDLKKDGKTQVLEIMTNKQFGFNTQYRVLTIPIP
tara:strand:+ start:2712 stop:3638 length:927 start_codon:yes stop_codon:yes gene_type:complete